MRRVIPVVVLASVVAAATGCSDDAKPVTAGGPAPTPADSGVGKNAKTGVGRLPKAKTP